MSPSCGMVSYGKEKIEFSFFYVDRKTMEISVHPDQTVVIKAPLGISLEEIHKRVVRRAGWIIKQRNFFRQFEPRTTPRRYVGGETHLYLGRHYRLKVCAGEKDELKLVRGFFLVTVKGNVSSEKVRELLKEWYIQKARVKFNEAFERQWSYFKKLVLAKPRLQMRHMKKRWGSLSENGLLTLNRDLIRAPIDCLDYVVTHELCHLKFSDHSPGFYQMLEKMMPDWEKRKHKLELTLV